MHRRYADWISRWKAALKACEKLGGKTFPLSITPPASSEALAGCETELGTALPPSLRTVLSEFSASVEVSWHLPEEAELPHELREIFSGECSWSLAAIVRAEQSRRLWVEKCFADDTDVYNGVWHNKLGFANVANGDVIAFDMSVLPDPPVVYLSHDDGEGHGYRLGDNFADYIDRFSRIGCPGFEDWQMMPFLKDAVSGLDPHGENAVLWRRSFGLSIEATL